MHAGDSGYWVCATTNGEETFKTHQTNGDGPFKTHQGDAPKSQWFHYHRAYKHREMHLRASGFYHGAYKHWDKTH